jgi:hypothetical protein
MRSEALIVPRRRDPATRSRSSQLSVTSWVLMRFVGEAVEGPVVRYWVYSPEAGLVEVGEAGRELVAEQPEQAEDDLGASGGVCGDGGRGQLGAVLEESFEDKDGVAHGARDHDVMELGVLVGDEAVEGDPGPVPEVVRVGTAVERSGWDHEAQAVGGRDVAAAPRSGEGDAVLVVDEAGVGRDEGRWSHVVVGYVDEPFSGEGGHGR